MRKHGFLTCLWLAGAVLLGTASPQVRAQWDVSGYESRQTPIPLGGDRMDQGGLFGAAEFLFMHGNRNIGSQLIAVRGFRDSDGSITGTSGSFVGSQRWALDTDSFGRTTWVPGFRVTVGYKLEDGSSFSVKWSQLEQARYNTSAGPIPVDFNTNVSGEDAFLFSPVFGFSPQFSGPQLKLADANGTPIGSGGSPYGIWNGANTMDIKFVERYSGLDITYRTTSVETDYSRSYATAGGRYAWIWERFSWNTLSSNYLGQTGSQDLAFYSNVISQRMYGPFIGVGTDVYLGSAFALGAEVSAAALYAIVKERAKYELGDESTQSKRSRNEFTIVPNVNASLNLSWFPLANVQIRAGYDLWSFFNTIYMNKPVGFNAGAIDPAYNHRPLRLYHGINVGIGLVF